MLKDGMLYSRCGRSTSGVECTNPGCQDALASARLASVTAERDALADQLAALKKRLADAVKSHAVSPWGGLSKGYAVGARTVDKPGRYALVRLEDGE